MRSSAKASNCDRYLKSNKWISKVVTSCPCHKSLYINALSAQRLPRLYTREFMVVGPLFVSNVQRYGYEAYTYSANLKPPESALHDSILSSRILFKRKHPFLIKNLPLQ